MHPFLFWTLFLHFFHFFPVSTISSSQMIHYHQHNNLIYYLTSWNILHWSHIFFSYHPISVQRQISENCLYLLSPVPHLLYTHLFPKQWCPPCKIQRAHNVQVFIFTNFNWLQYIEPLPHFSILYFSAFSYYIPLVLLLFLWLLFLGFLCWLFLFYLASKCQTANRLCYDRLLSTAHILPLADLIRLSWLDMYDSWIDDTSLLSWTYTQTDYLISLPRYLIHFSKLEYLK